MQRTGFDGIDPVVAHVTKSSREQGPPSDATGRDAAPQRRRRVTSANGFVLKGPGIETEDTISANPGFLALVYKAGPTVKTSSRHRSRPTIPTSGGWCRCRADGRYRRRPASFCQWSRRRKDRRPISRPLGSMRPSAGPTRCPTARRCGVGSSASTIGPRGEPAAGVRSAPSPRPCGGRPSSPRSVRGTSPAGSSPATYARPASYRTRGLLPAA
jgi:hypothetical protein